MSTQAKPTRIDGDPQPSTKPQPGTGPGAGQVTATGRPANEVTAADVAIRPGEAHDAPPKRKAERVRENERRAREVVAVGGGDWAEVTARKLADEEDDLMVLNMGPQHPSTHGVLRLVLALRGEEVISCQPVIGYLHTGIEKTTEFRTWVQGVTLVTRMDYLSPIFNETAYCLAIEKLLGIEAPPRAQAIRVLLMELNRIGSHLVWLATTGLELGALSMMLYGFREREGVLDILEEVTGLRMNHAYVRPGGVSQELPEGIEARVRAFVTEMRSRADDYESLLTRNPIWMERTQNIGHLDQDELIGLGVTGPLLRASGLAHDLRKVQPYCGYEQYDFEVPIAEASDTYARYQVRMAEIRESLKIIEQVLDSLPGGPVMIDDPKVGWPAKLQLGTDGLGNSPAHVSHIMGESMEALIHHFKMVTEGIKVPAGECYVTVESPRGELGYHVVSDGGNLPYRVHVRDPSFVNLQSVPHMVQGALVADVIAALSSVDPVLGGVDR
jgi:NADH-quinone oxidoreductase subunit D